VASDAILHALHDRLDLPIQDFGPGPKITDVGHSVGGSSIE
jgi:hypothetical protein